IGRKWPTNVSEACVNFKQNIKKGNELIRFMGASLCTIAGCALTVIFYNYFDESFKSNNVSTNSVSSMPTFVSSLDLSGKNVKISVVSGAVYGALCLIKCVGEFFFGDFLTYRLFMSSQRSGLDWERCKDRLRLEIKVHGVLNVWSTMISLLSMILIVKGDESVVSEVEKGNRILMVGLSSLIYLCDVGLILSMLICFDVYERDRVEELRQFDLVRLALPLHPNNGEGMPMMAMPPQAQDPGEMRGRG
ncbi:hypothetical protein, partial [Candidatus Clavichlamydia salmonicola]|uniref:hypothetical protein n=1 Tax=Candidatus Clavichlamydia salmonicola TaxID=469812 RepID=UPI001891A072